MYIYLDQNIIDDISKNNFSLPENKGIQWVYSNENFKEIKRSGSNRFLSVLRDLRAIEIEPILDRDFKITGTARYRDYMDPEDPYFEWEKTINNTEIDESQHLDLLGRLFGADNKESVLNLPERFRNQIEALLEPIGMYCAIERKKVDEVAADLETFTSGPLQEVMNLEENRQLIGSDKGKLQNFYSSANPLEEIWAMLSPIMPSTISADQFFGFEPIGIGKTPLFMGLGSCHAVLNMIGFKPDRKLSKISEIPSMLSDGQHIAMASFCDAFLTQDKRLTTKAKAIYKYKNITTQVLLIEPN